MIWLLIALAGGLGALGRACADSYLTRLLFPQQSPTWPAGIFLVNIIGSLLLGMTFPLLGGSAVGTVVMTGFLGGFTTFSTAMLDAVKLMRQGKVCRGLLVLVGNFLFGLLGFVVGLYLGAGLV